MTILFQLCMTSISHFSKSFTVTVCESTFLTIIFEGYSNTEKFDRYSQMFLDIHIF